MVEIDGSMEMCFSWLHQYSFKAFKLFAIFMICLLCFNFFNCSQFLMKPWIKPSFNNTFYRSNAISATTTVSDLIFNSDSHAWSKVNGDETYIFSSYLDSRSSPPRVRILVSRSCDSWKPLYCHLIVNQSTSVWSNTSVVLINSGCSTHYDAHFVICESIEPLQPVRVQLYLDKNVTEMENSRAVTIQQIATDHNSLALSHYLAICVSRTFDWHDWLHIVVFIEFYLSLGVTKFVFYHRSWSKDVDLLLKSYEQDGIVEIFSFPPPSEHFSEDRFTSGSDLQQQNLNLNDCSWRLMGRAKYVLVLDLDDFVTPTDLGETLIEVIRRYQIRFPTAGAFKFRNVQVHSEWPAPVQIHQFYHTNLASFTLKVLFEHLLYEKRACPPSYMGKSVHQPLITLRVSPHDVHQMFQSFDTQIVHKGDAVKFHWNKRSKNSKVILGYRNTVQKHCMSNNESFYEKRASFFDGRLPPNFEKVLVKRVNQLRKGMEPE